MNVNDGIAGSVAHKWYFFRRTTAFSGAIGWKNAYRMRRASLISTKRAMQFDSATLGLAAVKIPALL